MEGYAGMRYSTDALQAVALAGFGSAPFGASSRLYQDRYPFIEVGVRKPLLPNVSCITTFGRQYGHLSLDSVRLGLHATRQVGRVRFSAYAGRHMTRGSLGLPGYQAVDRKVSFSQGRWESRFSLSVSL